MKFEIILISVRISRACTDKVPANLHPIIECKEGDLGAAVGMYKDCKSTWEAKEDQGVNRDTNLIEKSLGKVISKNLSKKLILELRIKSTLAIHAKEARLFQISAITVWKSLLTPSKCVFGGVRY